MRHQGERTARSVARGHGRRSCRAGRGHFHRQSVEGGTGSRQRRSPRRHRRARRGRHPQQRCAARPPAREATPKPGDGGRRPRLWTEDVLVCSTGSSATAPMEAIAGIPAGRGPIGRRRHCGGGDAHRHPSQGGGRGDGFVVGGMAKGAAMLAPSMATCSRSDHRRRSTRPSSRILQAAWPRLQRMTSTAASTNDTVVLLASGQPVPADLAEFAETVAACLDLASRWWATPRGTRRWSTSTSPALSDDEARRRPQGRGEPARECSGTAGSVLGRSPASWAPCIAFEPQAHRPLRRRSWPRGDGAASSRRWRPTWREHLQVTATWGSATAPPDERPHPCLHRREHGHLLITARGAQSGPRARGGAAVHPALPGTGVVVKFGGGHGRPALSPRCGHRPHALGQAPAGRGARGRADQRADGAAGQGAGTRRHRVTDAETVDIARMVPWAR